MTPRPFVVFLVSPSATPCGVEMFARGLAGAADDPDLETRPLAVAGRRGEMRALWRALAGAEALVVNLPVVAWKKALLTPLIALMIARLRGARTFVVLHEWTDLHPLRRVFVGAYLLLAEAILFSSPSVRDALRAGLLGRLPFASGLAPIPPNMAAPLSRTRSPALDRIEAERAKGRLVIGHFGSIYPKKQSTFALDVASALRGHGRDAFVVFIGSFVKARDDVEANFHAHVARLGLEDAAFVTGYVEDETALFALFEAADLFVYAFPEGLTSRRGSVLTALEAGRPVIVNAPVREDEFDHHPVFRRLIARGALTILPTAATPADYARAIATIDPGRRGAPDIYDPAWRDAAAALRTALGRSDEVTRVCDARAPRRRSAP